VELILPIRVYIEDTDAGGIVYYVNYLKYMERARTEFMRELGFAKTAVTDNGLLMVVHSANVQYRRPARLDDEIQIYTSIKQCARSYIVFKQQARRADEVLCDAEIKVACVKMTSMSPTALPKMIKDTLTPLALVD
jgi:4-hydroxybenzoyl-CoA thioesterase/acyl-CoA thioester hydrolase